MNIINVYINIPDVSQLEFISRQTMIDIKSRMTMYNMSFDLFSAVHTKLELQY